MQIMTVDKVSH